MKPVCRLANFVGILVVKSDAPWNNFREVVEYVRKNPGMKFGITARGGSPHIIMLTIEKAEKIKFKDLSNPGNADVVTQMLGGHIFIGMVAYPSGKTQVEAGNFKVVATYAEKRFEFLPQIPTITELGCVPGHYPCIGLFVARDTPDPIVQKLCEVAKKVSEDDSYRQKIVNLDFQLSFENSSQYRDSLSRYKVDIGDFLKELGYVK